MAFAVVCKSCQARFLLNDDLLRRRVAGKVVTVRCRQCHAAIEVDASDVDPKTLPPRSAPTWEPAPPPKPAPVKTMTVKPAPAPPRPVRSSTLMGIGGPPRPPGATELVALSPGLLQVAPAVAAKATLHGFPEPPPPPGAVVEELSSSDWEIPDSKPAIQANAAVTPESLDDFVEELPPSLPPPEEEPLPSSSGTPSLKALTHHEEHVGKQTPAATADDFFSNISAAMNGGIALDAVGGAPTIDVSAFAAATAEAPTVSDVDFSSFDVPHTPGKTLPLFALGNDHAALLMAPPAAEPAAPAAAKPVVPPPAGGSLSPASLDRPLPASQRSDGLRERKNVVAPATRSVPPPAPTRRRSALSAPVLLALAAMAGFLIWKRSAATPSEPQTARPTAVVAGTTPAPVAPAPAAAAEPAAPVAVASVAAAPLPNDDVTFETTPSKALATATPARDKPAPVAGSTPADTPASAPVSNKPSEPPSTPVATPKPEPAPAVVKEEPKPAAPEPSPPGEPAGPFDRAAAAAALTAAGAQAAACRKDGDPSGVASVVITFAPSGRVTSANVSGPPFAGTPTGGCIASALRKVRIPAFDGERVTVSKTIVIQ